MAEGSANVIQSRSRSSKISRISEGWQLERLTPASRLYGANGLRTGSDGRLYVAQVSGSQISAIDVTTAEVEVISPLGGDIIGPDDLAFDSHDNLYVTEFTEGRLSVRMKNGTTRVLNDQIPGANPVTVWNDRLFVGECRPDGRIMEVDRDTGALKVLLENVVLPNAMQVGPDGMLYFPVMGTNEIWRISPDGGAPEVVAGGLGVPDALKFDAQGQIVSTQVHSGQVLRINPQGGAQTVLADIRPGLDNLSFVDGRLFVSHFSGEIIEVLPGGLTRSLLPSGLNWPLGLAFDEAEGRLFVADGPYTYGLKPGGELEVAGMLFTPGIPGYIRGIAVEAPGTVIVTTANGGIHRWTPRDQTSEVLAEGYDQLMGVALDGKGGILAVEGGAGRVLSVHNGVVEVIATGLDRPSGIAVGSDGAAYVSEAGAGRVIRISGGKSETVLDQLARPQGLVRVGERLYVLDVRAQSLIALDLVSGSHEVVAQDLPVGPPQGVEMKPLKPVLPLAGAMGPFAGLAADAHGTIYISGDAEGSVLALKSL